MAGPGGGKPRQCRGLQQTCALAALDAAQGMPVREEQLVNSWRMDIFMQGLPREREEKSVRGENVYKEATVNKVFVSFLGLGFQVHCFGFEKKQKGPHSAKLPSFQIMKAVRKPLPVWVCGGFEFFQQGVKRWSKFLWTASHQGCLFCSILSMWT